VAERVGDGDAAGRDGEDEPVAVLAGQLHRARAEARDVERDLRLEAEILRVVRQHPDGTNAVVVAVVHRLAAQQGGQHAQVLVVLRDAHGSLAHRAHRRVAGADAQVHAARRQPVQRRHRRHLHGRDPRTADGRARPQADPACLPCGQGQHGA